MPNSAKQDIENFPEFQQINAHSTADQPSTVGHSDTDDAGSPPVPRVSPEPIPILAASVNASASNGNGNGNLTVKDATQDIEVASAGVTKKPAGDVPAEIVLPGADNVHWSLRKRVLVLGAVALAIGGIAYIGKTVSGGEAATPTAPGATDSPFPRQSGDGFPDSSADSSDRIKVIVAPPYDSAPSAPQTSSEVAPITNPGGRSMITNESSASPTTPEANRPFYEQFKIDPVKAAEDPDTYFSDFADSLGVKITTLPYSQIEQINTLAKENHTQDIGKMLQSLQGEKLSIYTNVLLANKGVPLSPAEQTALDKNLLRYTIYSTTNDPNVSNNPLVLAIKDYVKGAKPNTYISWNIVNLVDVATSPTDHFIGNFLIHVDPATGKKLPDVDWDGVRIDMRHNGFLVLVGGDLSGRAYFLFN